jgi:hypothetical protein
MCFTAGFLFPLAAWATSAQLAALSPDVRALLTAASGRRQSFVADLVPPMAWVAAASLLGFVANQLLDAHPLVGQRRLLGLVLRLVTGSAGIALGLAVHARQLTRGTTGLLILGVAMVSVLVPWLPPEGPVLRAWADGLRHPTGFEQVWAIAGPLLATAVLLAVAARWRRRLL